MVGNVGAWGCAGVYEGLGLFFSTFIPVLVFSPYTNILETLRPPGRFGGLLGKVLFFCRDEESMDE